MAPNEGLQHLEEEELEVNGSSASQPLLSHEHYSGESSTISRLPAADVTEMATSTMTPMGRVRAYWLGIVVCIGGFLFGYDSGWSALCCVSSMQSSLLHQASSAAS
jgi:hypothetical protein